MPRCPEAQMPRSPDVPQSRTTLYLRKLSPLYTTIAFSASMYYNYPDLTKATLTFSKEKWIEYKKQRAIQKKIAEEKAAIEKAEAEKLAAIEAAEAKKREEIERARVEEMKAVEEAERRAREAEEKVQAELELARKAEEAQKAQEEQEVPNIDTYGEDPGQGVKEDEDLYTTRSKNEL